MRSSVLLAGGAAALGAGALLLTRPFARPPRMQAPPNDVSIYEPTGDDAGRDAAPGVVSPFHLHVDPMEGLLLINFENDPDRIYRGFEPQAFDDDVQGRGMLVLGWRVDGRVDVIPAEVYLEGTVRTFDPAVQDMIERRMSEILDGITRAGGGSFEMTYNRGYPVTVNDPELTARMSPTLARVAGDENLWTLPPTTGAEDFSYFAQRVPGMYFRLGTTRPGTPSGGLHTPTFTADDAAIPAGMRAMTALVLDYMEAPMVGAER